jgi:hypothetical protein
MPPRPHPPAADATGPSLSRDAGEGQSAAALILPLSRTAGEGAECSEAREGRKIADEIIRQTEACGAGRSICPSDVARSLDPDWRRLMTAVRRSAAQLAAAGRIDILRKGKPILPQDMRGVIRLRLRPAAADAEA